VPQRVGHGRRSGFQYEDEVATAAPWHAVAAVAAVAAAAALPELGRLPLEKSAATENAA